MTFQFVFLVDGTIEPHAQLYVHSPAWACYSGDAEFEGLGIGYV